MKRREWDYSPLPGLAPSGPPFGSYLARLVRRNATRQSGVTL